MGDDGQRPAQNQDWTEAGGWWGTKHAQTDVSFDGLLPPPPPRTYHPPVLTTTTTLSVRHVLRGGKHMSKSFRQIPIELWHTNRKTSE